MFKAILDDNHIYFGMTEVAELQVGDIEVPDNCDLPHGRYKYNAEQKCFEPLGRQKLMTMPNSPIADKALYELIKATPTPPDYCKKWADWFETTLDAKG